MKIDFGKYSIVAANKNPDKGPFAILSDGVMISSGYATMSKAFEALAKSAADHPRWFAAPPLSPTPNTNTNKGE